MVCRLGGLHTLISFLGSIGTYMAGSGIEQALALVYAPNTVNSLLTGKTYARAIRGHFLLDSALFYGLISELDQPRDLQHAFETITEDSTQTDDINKDDIDKFQGVVSELKGCVHYIFASLFCMSKREHF